MNTDTSAIIVAILGVGLALGRAIDSRHKDIRQDMAALRQELRAEIAAINNRIDSLFQALFSHKDPAA